MEFEPPKPDPKLRMGFPRADTRGMPVELAVAGILVSIQETGRDGYIYRPDGTVRTILAKSVRVDFRPAK